MKMKTEIISIGSLALLFVAVAIVLVGCFELDGGDGKSQPRPITSTNDDPPAAGEVQIIIEDFVFKPAEVTVSPGTKITWINKDEAPHTATSVDKKFNSGGLDTDDRFSFVFNDKGEYPYFCALHPHMKATITVK